MEVFLWGIFGATSLSILVKWIQPPLSLRTLHLDFLLIGWRPGSRFINIPRYTNCIYSTIGQFIYLSEISVLGHIDKTDNQICYGSLNTDYSTSCTFSINSRISVSTSTVTLFAFGVCFSACISIFITIVAISVPNWKKQWTQELLHKVISLTSNTIALSTAGDGLSCEFINLHSIHWEKGDTY